MVHLSFEDYVLPSASLGKLNPLPDIKPAADLHARIEIDESTVTEEEAQYMGWGRVRGILPYLIQDGYDRKKKPRAWQAAILENDHIRAVFMPQLGGRMWSLIDKHTGRELLQRNPVFQPANLALRNAWISGGVEFNIGIIGHHPYTVDQMFAESLALSDGTPVLRMYQYERVRGLLYRIEAMLPEDSRYVFVRVRIDNATARDTAVYWWSNIAVEEREDVRVLVPADTCFRYKYGAKLSKVPIPYQTVAADDLPPGAARDKALKGGGTLRWDMSRTTELPQAMDFFFNVPDARRRFISAVGGDGHGFIQTSTDVLKGRKLFVWGMGQGGRNWQRFLAEPGCAYIEIQAGLASTQLEHLPMKGNQTISWMEAYGPISADPAVVHGRDWGAATHAVEAALEAACPRAEVEKMLARAEAELDGRVGESAQVGAGWANVEKALMGDAFTTAGLAFPPQSMGRAEKGWLALIRRGALPCPDPMKAPGSYQIGDDWEALLAKSIKLGKSDHWYGHYQLGVMRARRGDMKDARASFKASLALAPSPWALRCIAVLKTQQGDIAGAATDLKKAVRMLPNRHIAIEAVAALNRAGRYKDAVRVVDALPAALQRVGRIRAGYIEALIETGALDRAERMLRGKIELTDVREGEVKLTDMWFRLCALRRAQKEGTEVTEAMLDRVRLECPPPKHLDFRMH